MSPLTFDELREDREAQWDRWLASLSESTRRILADPASDRELAYRALFLASRISLGALLLELLAVERAVGASDVQNTRQRAA